MVQTSVTCSSEHQISVYWLLARLQPRPDAPRNTSKITLIVWMSYSAGLMNMITSSV
jgi:hypothetical protein